MTTEDALQNLKKIMFQKIQEFKELGLDIENDVPCSPRKIFTKEDPFCPRTWKKFIGFVPKGMKHCNKCNTNKLLNEFNNNLSLKDGKYAWCRDCHHKYNSKWIKNNPEKNTAKSLRWQRLNPEKSKNIHKKWAINNPETVRECVRKWQKENPDKVKEYADNRRDNVSTFTLIPVKAFPKEIRMVGHHINYMFKVAIPESNHLEYYSGNDVISHRKKCLSLLNIIYDMNFIEKLM